MDKLRITIDGPQREDVHIFIGKTEITHLVQRMGISTAPRQPNAVSLQIVGEIELEAEFPADLSNLTLLETEWDAGLGKMKLPDLQKAAKGNPKGLAQFSAKIIGKKQPKPE